jgi:hypothetical protein
MLARLAHDGDDFPSTALHCLLVECGGRGLLVRVRVPDRLDNYGYPNALNFGRSTPQRVMTGIGSEQSQRDLRAYRGQTILWRPLRRQRAVVFQMATVSPCMAGKQHTDTRKAKRS